MPLSDITKYSIKSVEIKRHMGSSKKKGQQRKAAKKALAAEVASSDGVNSGASVVGGVGVGGGGGGNSKIVAKIRSGDNKATKKLSGLTQTSIIPLGSSGVLSIVLEFLNRCENETFEGVMSSVGGDLVSPYLWIKILTNASINEPSYKLQIAEKIGPLVSCMCNDTERVFFKSKKHWREGIEAFAELLGGMISVQVVYNCPNADKKEKIIETMLLTEGLLTSIVQWGHWNEHRPDISKEVKAASIARVVDAGQASTWLLVNDAFQDIAENDEEGNPVLTEHGKDLLKTIGTTPIINESYDSTCMVSYVEGLIHQMNHVGWDGVEFTVLPQLIIGAGCVDKGVITEIINLGMNHVKDHDIGKFVAKISFYMVFEKCHMNPNPSDTHTAFAIRAGLIEMLLTLIEMHGPHECFDNEQPSLFDYMTLVFKQVYLVSLHEKTAKAISCKRERIEQKLLHIEESNTIFMNNTKSKKIVDTVRCIINLNGSYCCRCNKSLSKTEVMECNGCSRMVYCSKACQKEDWLNGHKVTCNKQCTHENIGQFQGRVHSRTSPDIDQAPKVPVNERDAEKLKRLESNMTMIQLKLFLDNSDTILRQARSLNLPLCDCIVYFDLLNYPPSVTVKGYMTSFVTQDLMKGYEASRSKDNIMCAYKSSLYIRGLELEDGLVMQRLFPHEWLMKQSKES